MRKLLPKPIKTLRDGYVVLFNGKMIADSELYTESGQKLSDANYPMPKLTTTGTVVISELSYKEPSGDSRNSYVQTTFVADNGRVAEACKQLNDTGTNWREFLSGEDRHCFYVFGMDSPFPAVYTDTKGSQAGRINARHQSCALDVTAETTSRVLEPNQVINYGTSTSAQSPSTPGASYLGMSRILDESDTRYLSLVVQLNGTMSAYGSSTYCPTLQTVRKDYSVRDAGYNATTAPCIPLWHDTTDKVFFAWELSNSPTAYGLAGAIIRPIALHYSSDMVATRVQAGYTVTLDSFVSSTISGFTSNKPWRTLPIIRALKKADGLLTAFIPNVQGIAGTVQTNLVGSVSLDRVEYNYVTKTFGSRIQMNVVDPDTGLTPTWGENMVVVRDSNWANAKMNTGDNYPAHFQFSFMHEVDNETYVVILVTGNGIPSRNRNNNNFQYPTNTVQYTLRLDKADKTKAYLVARENLDGFFGTQRSLYSFAGTQDHSSLYCICDNDVVRLVFDQTQLKYVLSDTVIDVDAVSLLVKDNGDVWLMDQMQRVYQMRQSNADLVRLRFGQVNDRFVEAPYDVQLFVSAANFMGELGAKPIELVIDGPAVFKANNGKKLNITTSAADELALLITVTGYGEIYVTPRGL
ncbi:hypothetical protein O152_gp218 [Pseudomonas phage PaBG]|nr:hypothetical protein O152_gp218 [Pseudomonas phage PaBG]AGS82141.2 hypothetical protein PaBG_00268 [Pseudomonas phage PaBG]